MADLSFSVRQPVVKITDKDKLMNVLRADLWNYDAELIANRIGVHKSTIYAIRTGRTVWPRHGTLLALVHVMGYELWLMK